MSSFTRSLLIAVASVSFAGIATAQNAETVVQTPDIDTSPYTFSGEVNTDAAVVRSGPSENDYATLKLTKGTKLVVVGYRLDWLKIEPPAGSFCLVSQAFVDKRGDGTVGRITNPRSTIRVGSSLTLAKHKVPIQLDVGTDVEILGEVDEYYKITPPKGVYMYIDKKFVNPVRKIEDTTVKVNGQPSAVDPSSAAADGASATGQTSDPTPQTDTASPAASQNGTGPLVTTPPQPNSGNNFRVSSNPQDQTASTTDASTTTKELESNKPQLTTIQSLQEQLRKLEEDYSAAAQKDITEQPIDQLLTGYNGLLADPQLPPNARKVAEYRANALKLRKETLEQFLATKKMQAEIAAKQQDLKVEQEELQQRVAEVAVKRYAAVGRLVQSSLQLGNQTLYRLIDPATRRTIVYVRAAETPLADNLDKFVGIEGKVVSDDGAKLTYVQPTKVDVVDSRQVNIKVFGDYSPPSLSTQTVAGESSSPQ